MRSDIDNPLLVGIERVESYPFTTARELYEITPPPEIIEDFLPQGGIMGITSFPGVGKSWLTLEVVRAVSLGSPFLRRFRTTQGSCLFVGSDSSIFDYARQWARLARSDESEFLVRTADPGEDPEENRRREDALRETLGPDFHLGPFHAARFLLQSQFMFDSRDEIRRLISTARHFKWGPYSDQYDELDDFVGRERREGFDVIIFDTLSRLTRANQNDNSEMEEVFRNIRSIAELTGAAIIVLHHNSKRTEFNDGTDWRGAMSQIGALDSWVQLSPARNNKYLIGVEYKKFRGITPEDFAYTMDVNDAATASLTATDEHPAVPPSMRDKVSDLILMFLADNAGTRFSVKQVRDGLWDQCGDMFGGSRDKFVVAVRNRLEYHNQHPDPTKPRVMKSGGVSRGVTAFYWVEKKESTDGGVDAPAPAEEESAADGAGPVREHVDAVPAEAPRRARSGGDGGRSRPRRRNVRPAAGPRAPRTRAKKGQ